MKRLILMLTGLSACLLCLQLTRLFAAESPSTIVAHGPTIVAFFPPVTKTELQNDPDTNEALADFKLYATRVREPLKKSGIEFHELYAYSFQVRRGNTVTTFRPSREQVGYYFVAPKKKPRIEYGVMTDVDLLEIAHEYFGTPAQSDHPRLIPEDATVANEVSPALVGKQITIHGKFSLWGKFGAYVELDNQQVAYLEHRGKGGTFTWGKPYSEMEGKLVEVTGVLRFYHAPPAVPTDRTVARAPDYFYFEVETAQVRLIRQ